ncbi:MAG: succinate dehydrogenase, hydrophobic membrane anchor protein [Rickettsiaceae bacterium]|nr:succinate dehydrogenase, hydrophobic membrane anchor protein [Rickettsiaceae bacterium]
MKYAERSKLSRANSSGASHWWHQRITSIIMVPLTIWLVYFSYILYQLDPPDILKILHIPYNVVMIEIFLVTVFYHSALGMQMVIEDYVSNLNIRHCLILALYIFVTVTVISSMIALLFLMII